MAYIQCSRPGNNTVYVTVDPTYKAARTTLRPVEMEGSYRLSVRSGVIAAATAAAIQFSFRYVGTGSCLIHSVKLGLNGIAGYTQNNISYTLNVVRGWSVSDTAGTQTTLGNIQKLRSSMTQSMVDARISTTGAVTAAAAGVAIEDPSAFSSIQHELSPVILSQPMKEFLIPSWYSKSLTLTPNEGFRIRNQSAYGAVGTCNIVVAVEWSEFPATGVTFY